MAFYEPQGWQAPVRQASWEQPAPPSRSGASSTSQQPESNAFATQLEEVDRAIDNLVKSGKLYPHGNRQSAPPSYPQGGRSVDHGSSPRFHGSRHSVSEAHYSRPGSASNVQNFYVSQRFQGRQSDGDPMMQAKRRMAAQRERELRNYHQEQQYNRSVLAEMASNKSERSMSPSTLSEEGRRDLIARQQRALYGADNPGFASASGGFGDEGQSDQGTGAPNSAPGAKRGASPRGIDPFGAQPDPSGNGVSGDRKAGSPTFQQPLGKNSTSPTSEDPTHARQISKSTTAPPSGAMGPIGSRPAGQGSSAQSMNKRTTSPLPATLGFGSFGTVDQNNERSNSSNSGGNQKENSNTSIGTWGTGSGVWGTSNKIGSAVWG